MPSLAILDKRLGKVESSLLKGATANNHEWQISPHDGPQKMAFESQAFETLYGGSAGGGKSFLILMLAAMSHRRSIIFRRTYPNLRDLIETSLELLGGVARYNSIEKIWRDIPGNRILEFGSVQYEKDKESYRGRQHDLKCFDELTEFSETQYTFITKWTRTAIEGQNARIVATCNPPTDSSGQWIIDRWGPWLDPNHDHFPTPSGELKWYAMIDGKEIIVDDDTPIKHTDSKGREETIIPKSRTFVAARLSDNPSLGDDYKSLLQSTPEPLRSQLLYGDFSIKPSDNEWQCIPSAWVDAAVARWNDRDKPERLTSIGVDVARGGADNTVISKRYGNYYDELVTYPGPTTPDGPAVAAQVVSHHENGAYIWIDVVGVGGSVYDALKGSYKAYAFGGSEKAENDNGKRHLDSTETLEFVNKRSWSIWRFREMLSPDSGHDIALPPNKDLKAELCAARWGVAPPIAGSSAKGRIKIESKDEIKKRIGRSPDLADAVIYASIDGKRNKKPRKLKTIPASKMPKYPRKLKTIPDSKMPKY